MQREAAKLKQYLLGELDARETEEMDLQLIEDGGLAEDLRMAEHELIEDYLEGGLPRSEAEKIETRFLVSAERRAELREIQLFRHFAKRASRPGPTAVTEAAPAPRRRWFSGLGFRPILAAAAIVLGLLVLGLIWTAVFRDPRTALEVEYAELNKRDLGDLASYSGYSQLNLAPAVFRDPSSLPRERAEKLTDTVVFRLALPARSPAGAVYDARVRQAGVADFAVSDLRTYRNQSGQEVRLLVPKSILRPGQHQIIVEPRGGGSAQLTFPFAVE